VADPPKRDFSGIDPETGERWSPRKVVEILGLRAVNDEGEIRAICSRVVEENPKQAVAYRTGKVAVLGYFIKAVMDATRNGAHPEITTRVLKELLK
jgi:aspartyl-tRNA(Asn)/glutamyl-tRNA(Gln) amidotransferase subunit B